MMDKVADKDKSPQQKSPDKNAKQEDKKKKKKENKQPSVFERLQAGNLAATEENVQNDIQFDMDLQTQKAQELYRQVNKATTDEAIKKTVIEKLIQHRGQSLKELQDKASLINQGQRYNTDECKEFSLLSPNMQIKKQMQEKGINDDFFETRTDLEDGNIYLLTKINKILNGNLLKSWKHLQDQRF